jgi:hypothetical protein
LIAAKLLCKVFKAGYFIKWDDDAALLFSKGAGVNITHSLANDVVKELIKRDFFHKGLFERFAVLTSNGIQKRYIRICTDAKRKDWKIEKKYDVTEFTPEETKLTRVETTKTLPEKQESKEKESKENRKYSSGADAPRAHWNLIVEQWFLFNQEKFGEKPSFAGADPRHLKKIIDIIERRAMDKNIQWTEQYAIKRFKDFLSKAYQDDWLSKNFLLRHLENFIDKIILNQNGNGKANGQGHAHKPVITGTAEGSGKFE